MLSRIFLSALIALFVISPLAAQEKIGSNQNSSEQQFYVPPDLSAWVEWIKESNPDWQCARNSSTYVCAWPGTLKYTVGMTGADFTISVEALSKSRLPLPSSAGLYPRSISVRTEAGENVSAPLILEGSQLWTELPKGKFEIKGSFSWSSIPPELPAPGSYGLVGVNLPDELKDLKTRRGPQSLWLEKKEENANTESLNLSVMRRVSDGSPLNIETLLRLRISGRSRPLLIPSILPLESQAVTLESPIPAQLSPEGNLALQLLPGEYEIRILALMQQPVTEIKVPAVNFDLWPKEEVWSWQPDMSLRSVELSGGQPLHADLTQLPDDWKSGAVYVLTSGSEVKLSETRRGEQSTAPDNIVLSREFWIDLDGSGATVLDKFSGRLNRNFRINAQSDTQVGRATVDGEAALVTLDPKTRASGIELRSQNLNMEVVSRLGNAHNINANGWDLTADSLNIIFNLPPSWKILHVAGAAKAIGSWVDSWTLLNIFITILLSLASYKIFGKLVAIILGISLVLNHGEFLAPQMLYVHIMLLATWCRLTESKESIWRTLSQSLLAITFAAWTLQSLAFAKLQFTEVLFPQLQSGTRIRTVIQDIVASLEDSILAWPLMLLIIALVVVAIRSIIKSKGVFQAILRIFFFGIAFFMLVSFMTAINIGASRSFIRSAGQLAGAPDAYQGIAPQSMELSKDSEGGAYYEEKAGEPKRKMRAERVQSSNTTFSYQGKNLLSGPALPAWQWHSVALNMANPVSPDHNLHFYFLSPIQNRILSAVRTVLALLLIGLIFRALGFSLGGIKRLTESSPQALASVLVVLAVIAPATVNAEIPDKEILNQLKSRFEQRLCSRDQCTVIESADFNCSDSTFKLELKVSSDGISSIKIPGPIEALAPLSVKLNGKSTLAMRRDESGYLMVRTDPGDNLIEVEGNLPDAQAYTVQFAQNPLVVSVSAPGWYVEGLSANGTVSDNLRFIRRSADDKDKTISANPVIEGLNTWVKVSRNITVGEQISVETDVERLGSLAREAHVRIALMPGEQVISGSVSIENNELLIGFAADQQTQSFSSTLPFADQINFLARPVPNVAEQWIVSCQPILACEFSGLQPTSSTIDGVQSYLWLPFPGEEVSLKVSVLSGLKGDFVTVDNLTHDVRWGTNLLEGSINASVRATQQTIFRISAPADSVIKEVMLDGQAGQSSEKDSQSSLLLSPGSHTIQFKYNKSWNPQFSESVPLVTLSAPANNLRINVTPSQDRWILWTGGLAWGPGVVFWAKLLIVVLICIALSRFGLIPASAFSALMLGMGVTTLPLWAISIPLGWLAVIKLIPVMGSRLLFIPRAIRASGFILFCIVAITIWYHIVQTGLVFAPPMLIAGNGSSSFALKWYVDHVAETLPAPYVISLPVWCWRIVALIWSTWLVVALFGWLKSCVGIVRSEFVSGVK